MTFDGYGNGTMDSGREKFLFIALFDSLCLLREISMVFMKCLIGEFKMTLLSIHWQHWKS